MSAVATVSRSGIALLGKHKVLLVGFWLAMGLPLDIRPRNHRTTQAVGSNSPDAALIVQIIQDHHLVPNPLASLDAS